MIYVESTVLYEAAALHSRYKANNVPVSDIALLLVGKKLSPGLYSSHEIGLSIAIQESVELLSRNGSLDVPFFTEKNEHCKLLGSSPIGYALFADALDDNVISFLEQSSNVLKLKFLLLFPSNFNLNELTFYEIPDNIQSIRSENCVRVPFKISEYPSGYFSALQTLSQLDSTENENSINTSSQRFTVEKLQSCALHLINRLEDPSQFSPQDLSSISHACRLLDSMEVPSDTYLNEKLQVTMICNLQKLLYCTNLIEKYSNYVAA
ncbi:Schizosaccharomyces specific protein [Schizosaccharomyces osmophilus]|uniref:Schizosaccharomyces specific protein n=1 Tax=Schizosaccharomyces osmophilus TaxID=2545709 RepID=A0AAE9W869_9SCHI|nr:Schizosaccharomyces specific protein [Schizosaccharomyces osmophilus]WBW70647.1 Schizosaccharomyces specific protein [Schizosaccharomyces osmophilus]